MITIKRVNTLTTEAYARYWQAPHPGQLRDRESFPNAVNAVSGTSQVFATAQVVLGAATKTLRHEALPAAEGEGSRLERSRTPAARPEGLLR